MQNDLKTYTQMVMCAELNAIALYEHCTKFNEVFAAIHEIRKNGIILIENFAQANKIELSTPQINQFFISDNLKTSLLNAISYENSLADFYENLTDKIEDETLKDICFRLWATSFNEYKPSLEKILNYEGGNTKDGEEFSEENDYIKLINENQQEFANINEKLKDIVSGKASKEDIAKILNDPKFSFFSGLALGALGASLLSKDLEKEEE